MKSKKNFFRFVSLMLASFMVFGLLPVFADDQTGSGNMKEDFEGAEMNANVICDSDGVALSTSDIISGKKSLLMTGPAYIYTADFPTDLSTSEDIVVSFKLKLKDIPSSLDADNNFLAANELLHLCTGEEGKLPSNNYYSAKFRVLKGDDGIQFTGNSLEGNPTYADTCKDKTGGVSFPSKDVYNIKLTFTYNRCYVDINNGKAATSFQTTREAMNDLRLTVRSGVTAVIDDFEVSSSKEELAPMDATLQSCINAGAFTGYIEWEQNRDGVEFYRHTKAERVAASTFNKCYSYQSGVSLDMFTNSRSVSLTYTVEESAYSSGWTTIFDAFINGKQQPSSEIISKKGETYTFTLKLPDSAPAYNRVTIMFPTSINVAVQKIALDESASIAAVKKDKNVLVLGDSISEGSECFSPAAVYANGIAMNFNYNLVNEAISGTSFSNMIQGEYNGFTPDYIVLSYGTNNYGYPGGTNINVLNSLDNIVTDMIDNIKSAFPKAKIIAITPIWRNDWKDGPEYTLQDIIDKLKGIYKEYPEITVVDGIDLVPHSADYFYSPTLMLHPNTKGHTEYYKNLQPSLVKAGMTLSTKDWAAEAAKAFAPSDWAKAEVDQAIKANLVPASIQSNYTQNITRNDFCNLVVNMIEVKSGKKIADFVKEKTGKDLTDKPFPDSANVNVNAASKLGIVNGRTNGSFDPNGSITRQEAAKMLALAAKALGNDITAKDAGFADKAKIADWAKDYVNFVFAKGVMNGTGNNNFSPTNNYTREQSVLTIYRLFNAK